MRWPSKTILNALIWAAAMIGVASVLAGSEQTSTVTMLLTAGWFASNGVINSEHCGVRCKSGATS